MYHFTLSHTVWATVNIKTRLAVIICPELHSLKAYHYWMPVPWQCWDYSFLVSHNLFPSHFCFHVTHLYNNLSIFVRRFPSRPHILQNKDSRKLTSQYNNLESLHYPNLKLLMFFFSFLSRKTQSYLPQAISNILDASLNIMS